MTTAWKSVRVFISSTFRDMQAERDHLVRLVFPKLREVLQKHRIHLEDVDLRWGVTSEQDALEVCREIIDECRPRFLCMLGGRYGWSPPGQNRSITADEVHFAALDDRIRSGYHHFYFRDPAATAAMVEQTPAEYREPEGSENHRKLEGLKQAVIDAGYEPFLYPASWSEVQQRLVNLDRFGQQVYADLLASVDDEFGVEEPGQLEEFAEEQAQIEAFMEERSARYIAGARQAVLDELAMFVQADRKPSLLVLTGTPGSGKSALLAKFCRDWNERRSARLVPHFVGASVGSTDIRRTLRRLCHELQTLIRESNPAAELEELPQDYLELSRLFPQLLEKAAGVGRIVLVIDAVNQMDATDNAHAMNWLPQQPPENVRVIVSSLAHPALEALRQRGAGMREVELLPLDATDARVIMEGVLSRHHKRMSDEQIILLLEKEEAGTPLYLLVALEELRTLGDYDAITERIRNLPGTTRDLFLWILKDRLEADPGFRDVDGNLIGPRLVRMFVSCLAVSRHGLSHAELAGLIAPGDPTVDPPVEDDALGNVAALERLLRPYLMQRGDLLDFFHGQLTEAVAAEYLDEAHEPVEAHRHIADYFHRQLNPVGADPWSGDSVRGVSELPFHQTQGESWDQLEQTLCDLRFVQAKCTAGMTFELVRDYNDALAALPELQAEREAEERRIAKLQKYGQELIAYSQANDEGVALPEPPDTRPAQESIRRVEASSQQSATLNGGDTRSARLRAFANFVSGQSHVLNRFPAETFSVACNHASYGEVSEQAERIFDFQSRPWLRSAPRQPAPPGRPLCVRTLVGHALLVYTVALTPDGNTAVSASEDLTLRVWDVRSGECLRTLAGHTREVYAAALTPDGETAVSASGDNTLRVWDVRSGECLRTLAGHTNGVKAVALTPDSRTAVSESEDNTLRVWDVASGDQIAIVLLESEGYSVAVAAGNRIVAGTTSGQLHFLTLENWPR